MKVIDKMWNSRIKFAITFEWSTFHYNVELVFQWPIIIMEQSQQSFEKYAWHSLLQGWPKYGLRGDFSTCGPVLNDFKIVPFDSSLYFFCTFWVFVNKKLMTYPY